MESATFNPCNISMTSDDFVIPPSEGASMCKHVIFCFTY